VRPNPSGKQTVDKPAVRKQIRKLEKKLRWLDKKERKTGKKVEKVRDLKQSRMRKPTRERIAKRRAERERAEAKLEAAIAAMITLTRGRAGRLGAAGSMRWRKPLAGRISQRYGCTGYPTNPRRGGCRHFHDGVDIAAPVGSKIRASADGLVAYVGFSPWDGVKRAFIVVLVHPGGYESVYAHLKPTRKVRAGQVVDRGEVIGKVGMTGLTTGPHVHWEVRRGGTWLNPLKVGR
jgi:murein DD-endopeptidase MepM/ murein hydrolase activator NlpD